MIKVFLNGKEELLYTNFSVTKSLSNFVDSFSISLANHGGIVGRTIPVGCYINIYYNDIEIFRGICESKKVSYGDVGSTVTFSGREELLLITEDDISPLHKGYKKVSDNFIIQDVCAGYGWNFQLATAKIIKEYEIANNGVRKGQVVNDVVSQNNFYIYKIGNTIYKKETPKEADYTKRVQPQFTLASQGGSFTDLNNRILDVSISEDISACKSVLKGFTYGSGNSKVKIKRTIENAHLLNGTYPKRLRNINSEDRVAPRINRFVGMSIEVKSQEELNATMEKRKVDTDIDIDVSISVAEFLDLNLLDTAEIFIQDEDIKQYMYVKEMSYNYDSSNKFYTSYSFTPIIPVENS